jgi:Rieske Fe-S protein
MGRIAQAVEDPQKVRPQAGDIFIFPLGDHQGQVITPQDLPIGGPPVLVYPTDPATQTLRNGSRLNRVLLVRLAQEDLTEQTRAVAVEGVVGYSAICPHTGCDVIGWENGAKHLVCPCHSSAFDPKDRARVVGGPAPRALAALPLQLTDGKLAAAGPFLGRVGAEQK